MTSPFLRFVHMSPRGSIVFEYGDGEEVCARLNGDTLTWDDGYVYYRIGRQTDDETGDGMLTGGSIAGDIIPAGHICDMSSVVSTAATTTTVVHLRKLDGEELPSLTPLQSADCLNGDGEAITIPEVLAETDEEKKADAAIVDTGGDAHVKITGRDCVADYDCDYWYGTGIMDENMEYRSGDGGVDRRLP